MLNFVIFFTRFYATFPDVENNRVIRSAFKVGSFTSLSRVLGLVRDILTASVFGTSAVMSDFVVAFRLPNLFRALFGEGALSSAFVPVFMATRKEEGDQAAWVVARKTVTLVAAGLFVVVLLLIGATYLFQWLKPDLVARAPHLLPLMRVMLPYVLFICLAGLFMAMLNAYYRFSLPALTPSLLNIVWIAFILLVCPRLGSTPEQQIYGLALAIFVAGIVQMGVQLPALVRLGFRPGFAWDIYDKRVRRVFTLMGPTALGSSVTQVNVMVNALLARWAASWAPASLFYAERLIYLPQGLLATAMSTVLLPVLSGHAARGNQAEMRSTLNHSLRTLLFVMIPASVGLLVLAEPIVKMLFGHGRFDADAVRHTSIALQFYAPGLMVFCLAKIFVPAFYAMQDTRTPFLIGLRAVALNFILNVVFVVTWPLEYKHAGLALSTVISEAMNGLTLGVLLHRRLGSLAWASVGRTVIQALLCSAVMAAVISVVVVVLSTALEGAGLPVKVAEVISVLGSIALGMAAYFLCAFVARMPEIGFARDAILRRK